MILALLIRIYQKQAPARIKGSCRMTPHCSAYGLQAAARYGSLIGTLMILGRFYREINAHPANNCPGWPKGPGWDPGNQ